jgi:hypothetical protein
MQKRYPSFTAVFPDGDILFSGKQPEESNAKTMMKQLGQYEFIVKTLNYYFD